MSGYGSVTRGSPLGCVIGILAVVPLAIVVTGAYAFYKIHQVPVEERDPEMVSMVVWCTLGGVIGLILVVGTSLWILRRTNWKEFDAENPRSQM